MVGRTGDVAGQAPAGRRRRPRVGSGLAAALLLAATCIVGARDAGADWREGYPTLSPAAAAHPRLTSLLTGLPELGAGLPRSATRGPELAALVPSPLLPADAAAPLGPVVDAAYVPDTPIVSGLPWRSGAACSDASFGTWRGRPMDVNVTFAPHTSWKSMHDFMAAPYYRTVARRTPQMVASLAMLPQSHKGQHAACAAGAFDAEFRRMGAAMALAGAGSAIVRLGWEANVGADSHPWGIDTQAQVPAYIGCFQRAATALKSTAPGLKIEWTNAKRGSLPFSVLETYPGDAYVDLFGIHYYDTDPSMPTQALWDERLNATTRYGSPHGIAAWLRTAQAYGMKMAVSEWGVRKLPSTAQPDNALYVENMYRFIRANADGIAYESYFNCNESEHRIYPVGQFPKASAAYQRLWSAGQ